MDGGGGLCHGVSSSLFVIREGEGHDWRRSDGAGQGGYTPRKVQGVSAHHTDNVTRDAVWGLRASALLDDLIMGNVGNARGSSPGVGASGRARVHGPQQAVPRG